MIPAIRQTSPIQAQYLNFIETLRARGFSGDLNADYANRTVLATDNSIYQVLPQGVLYPKSTNDLILIAQLSNETPFHDIVLSPRGGGTGTNGQSLTDGLIVDLSKHMNQVLEINAEERWVRVQTGVVKDQLNAAIKPYGLFFAPELSTSNRATIGGMINTDASGQGSCAYGKTRDHVLALNTVLLDGSVIESGAIDDEQLTQASKGSARSAEIYRLLNNIEQDHSDLIKRKFPKLNRCLTGYDLAHIRETDGRLNLNSVLCGSEGSLGFITEAKLNLLPIPKCVALVNIKYTNFNAALRDASELMKAQPTSIETVDSKVLNLAMGDIIWNSVAEFFPRDGQDIQGINLVEYTADSDAELEQKLALLLDKLDNEDSQVRLGYTIANGSTNVNKIWAMRKKSVGLLGNAQGEARPIPFVEDTAVPPENLADFILEFREVLDNAGLAYGMFGHVDAGVLHVRPTIDMKDPKQETLIRDISDKVAALTHKYNGLLWGEHGKGLRSEYAPKFFGELYPQLQRIKAAFDPRNQLNPGKIATPSDAYTLTAIDKAPTRGQQDRKIPVQVWEGYSEGMFCNGNGACYNWNPNDYMCPSWKGTRERIHSPKGRASLIREWLKQLSERDTDAIKESHKVKNSNFIATLLPRLKNTLSKQRGEYDFNHEVHESMMGCLACKSCAGQCPIKVNVPEFRSKFMELYYGRYLRPLKDYFIGGLEMMIPTLAKAPWLYNVAIDNPLSRPLLEKAAGMVDSPRLTGISLNKALERLGVAWADAALFNTMTPEEKANSVIIVQDAFTSYFETQLVIDVLDTLKRLGFTPYLAPYTPNGKPLHVHGFLKAFNNTAMKTSNSLNKLADSGIALAGIDPSMTLAYRSEYKSQLGEKAPNVQLIQEWLAPKLQANTKTLGGQYTLLAHCTEASNAAASIGDWGHIFNQLGIDLSIENAGCCGMAGTYGHETVNLDTSKKIYSMAWSDKVKQYGDSKLLATGYSCRSQVKRIDEQQLQHPLQLILKLLQNT